MARGECGIPGCRMCRENRAEKGSDPESRPRCGVTAEEMGMDPAQFNQMVDEYEQAKEWIVSQGLMVWEKGAAGDRIGLTHHGFRLARALKRLPVELLSGRGRLLVVALDLFLGA